MSKTVLPGEDLQPAPFGLPTRTYGVAPISQPVEILVDPWGIAHIYASSLYDAYVVQGFNAARDRLWQIDMWRRRGLGLLSEVLGPAFVRYDRAARLFLYRGSMDEEWAAYGDGTREAIEAFVAGINAFVAHTRQDKDLLPPEFGALGYEPAEWSAADVVRIRRHGRYRNVRREVTRAQIVRDFGIAADRLRAVTEPDTDLTVPDGLDLGVIHDRILGDYDLATGPLDLSVLGARIIDTLTGPEGSNAWAVSPERTATGRPLLASDPHRAIGVPALRYAVHVETPELSFAGAGEPQLPGISIGHNGQIAFGLTILPLDLEDVYVYDLDAIGGMRYRYRGGWEQVRVERTVIPVRAGEDVEVELPFTRHGPVVHWAPDTATAFAVRAAWLQPGMAPYVASIALTHARKWDQFRDESRSWGAPGSNLVYADAAGHIGWLPRIGAPVRPNWTGLLPVPGDGRYEWDGFLSPDSMPSEHDPERGWIATANELNLSEQQLTGGNLGFEWEPPMRYERIADVLTHNARMDVPQTLNLQTDSSSQTARTLLPLIAGLTGDSAPLRTASALFAGWDGHLAASSAAAALFEVWFRRFLRPGLRARELHTLAQRGELRTADPDTALARLTQLSDAVGDARIELALVTRGLREDRAALLALLGRTLEAATIALQATLGDDPAGWSWGQLHRAALSHPLEPVLPDDLRELARLPAPMRGGSGDTVGSTGYSQGDYAQDWGASWRMIIDVGNWDESVAVNAPGQSGDPRSPHYGDLLSTWAADQAVPLLFSRPRVVEVATERILVTPGD